MRERELMGEHDVTNLPGKVKKAIRLHARRKMIKRWSNHLSAPRTAGQRTVGAIRPCLTEWLDRVEGEWPSLGHSTIGHVANGRYN